MDLEKYKETWESQPEETNKVSKVDIYKMSHSKSSSIVKWIFIIGILEVLFWSSLNFFTPDDYIKVSEDFNLKDFLHYFMVLHYIVIFLFLILFYRNYSSVSVVDSTKILMNKILRVRKTVKYYVYYNLIGFIVITIIVNGVMFSNTEVLMETMNPNHLDVNANSLITTTLIIQILVLLVMLLILWLFYKLTYGTLLKKLNRNYKELGKIEELN